MWFVQPDPRYPLAQRRHPCIIGIKNQTMCTRHDAMIFHVASLFPSDLPTFDNLLRHSHGSGKGGKSLMSSRDLRLEASKSIKQDAAHEPECSHVCWWHRCQNTWICNHAEHFSAIVYLNSLVHISPVTSLQCRVWSVKCGVRSVECVKCRVWSVECKV